MHASPDNRSSNSSQNPVGGVPGQFARLKGLSAALSPVVGVAFAAGFVCGAVLHPEMMEGWFSGILLLALAGALYVAWKRAVTIYLRYEAGAMGEEKVARVLEGIPGEWRLFHNISVGGKECDHVLLGRGQIFSIETVNWPGSVRVKEGRLMHGKQFYPGYDLKTLHERAEQFAHRLGVKADRVKPAVCMVGGRYGDYAGMQDGVWLGEIQDLVNFILGEEPGALTETEMVSILETLESEV
ncbi:nuclease-related domain-containing protein [Kiritimatiellota bacterium B12222]|nr:nuclease-related domain-containing protein [Kiritimatiellota bacterium B12222]